MFVKKIVVIIDGEKKKYSVIGKSWLTDLFPVKAHP